MPVILILRILYLQKGNHKQTFLHLSISEYKYSSAYLYTHFEHFLLT